MYSMVLLIFLPFQNCISVLNTSGINRTEQYDHSQLQEVYGGNIHYAVYHITLGFPTDILAIVYDQSTDGTFIGFLSKFLENNEISVYTFNITTLEQQDLYFKFVADMVNNYMGLLTIHFCSHKLAEHILIQIYEQKLIRRNLTFMFHWGNKKMYRFFIRNMHETMKIVVITNPRPGAYRLYFNQATSHKRHNLQMVNWWIEGRGLFRHPTLPRGRDTYNNFNARIIQIPVIHKPPWHFVQYSNESMQVTGGRDDKLLKVLAKQLNFRFEYFDPPERIQGSSYTANGTFDGVLGLVYEKEVEFFLGDIALTLDRFKAVEFSFLTLADSGAFVTHAPSKLNEAWALIRPFNPQVWPAILITVLLSGPILYLIIILPNIWHPKFLVRDHTRLLVDCIWYTTGIFFRQSGNAPSESHKSRLIIILLSIAATYVIGDMYAAHLTSLLARPGREKPIENLWQLEEAMKTKGYRLLVEKFSSSYSLLENGTGIYGRLWEIMSWNVASSSQNLVDDVETGVKLVRDNNHVVLMAGRETLFFDTQRFGASNFHMSEKLNTAYSAIALQQGCPYKWNINTILMRIFESGILTKMTQDEYEKLGNQRSLISPIKDLTNPSVIDIDNETRESGSTQKREDDATQRLQPINIRMLQGAFYLLGIGILFSAIVLAFERIYVHRKRSFQKQRHWLQCNGLRKQTKMFELLALRILRRMKRMIREAMNEAIIATLDYIE